MEDKDSFAEVEIFGRTYSLRADGSPDYLRELARYVDGKMNEVARVAPTVDPAKIAILAALNISDEFYEYRNRHRDDSRLLEDLETRAGGWIRRLEESLETPKSPSGG